MVNELNGKFAGIIGSRKN